MRGLSLSLLAGRLAGALVALFALLSLTLLGLRLHALVMIALGALLALLARRLPSGLVALFALLRLALLGLRLQALVVLALGALFALLARRLPGGLVVLIAPLCLALLGLRLHALVVLARGALLALLARRLACGLVVPGLLTLLRLSAASLPVALLRRGTALRLSSAWRSAARGVLADAVAIPTTSAAVLSNSVFLIGCFPLACLSRVSRLSMHFGSGKTSRTGATFREGLDFPPTHHRVSFSAVETLRFVTARNPLYRRPDDTPAALGTKQRRANLKGQVKEEGDFPMRAVLAGAALTAFVVTPTLADYYIIQEPTTKRCRIIEERRATPSVGVVIGGAGFGVRTEAESRMRTVEECRETGTTGRDVIIEEGERRPAR